MSDRYDTHRLEAFSDGVFAIAITLLILEINVPDASFADLRKGIADQWPSYLAYVTSFLTIGVTWLHHHRIFRHVEATDSVLIRVNMVLLMEVSFLPFPTMLMARAINKTQDAERVAVIFYGLGLLAISITMAAIWFHAVRHDLLGPDVTDRHVTGIHRLTASLLVWNLVPTSFAFFAPRAAVIGYLAIVVIALFRRYDTVGATARDET